MYWIHWQKQPHPQCKIKGQDSMHTHLVLLFEEHIFIQLQIPACRRFHNREVGKARTLQAGFTHVGSLCGICRLFCNRKVDMLEMTFCVKSGHRGRIKTHATVNQIWEITTIPVETIPTSSSIIGPGITSIRSEPCFQKPVCVWSFVQSTLLLYIILGYLLKGTDLQEIPATAAGEEPELRWPADLYRPDIMISSLSSVLQPHYH